MDIPAWCSMSTGGSHTAEDRPRADQATSARESRAARRGEDGQGKRLERGKRLGERGAYRYVSASASDVPYKSSSGAAQ